MRSQAATARAPRPPTTPRAQRPTEPSVRPKHPPSSALPPPPAVCTNPPHRGITMSPTSVLADANTGKDDRAAARTVAAAIALAVVTIISIGHAYWSNASTWTAPETPPVLGFSTQSAGLHVNDVYLTPERRASARGSVTADVLASMAIDSGPSDRLLSVRVAGHRAELIDVDGRQAGSGLPVSAWAPLSAQPGAHRAHVRISLPAADVRPGSLVQVILQFAVRGAVTTTAPVWPSANGPSVVNPPAGASATPMVRTASSRPERNRNERR